MKDSLIPILTLMALHGRPAFAQSSEMSVITLPPPTVAATSSDSTPQATASVVPSILYPNGAPILNNIDTLVVNYITPWQSVDMIIKCGEDTSFSNKISGSEHIQTGMKACTN
jgi:hypothetical protein